MAKSPIDADRVAAGLGPEPLDHRPRQVDAVHRDAPSRQRERDAAGPDAELQRAAAAGELGEEVDRGIEPAGLEEVGRRVVVPRGGLLVEVVRRHRPTLCLATAQAVERTRIAAWPASPTISARIPLFSGLNKRQLRKLAGGFKEDGFAPGRAVVREGRVDGVGFFVIAEGTAAVSVGGEDGRDDRPGRLLRRACDADQAATRCDGDGRDAAPLSHDPVLGLSQNDQVEPGCLLEPALNTSPRSWLRIAPSVRTAFARRWLTPHRRDEFRRSVNV